MSHAVAPIRIGFAGCGNVLSAYAPVAESLQRRGLARITALCGPRPEAAAAHGLGHLPFETDYPRFLARTDLDAVVLLTPMPQHAAMASAALEAGKHVLVEKPLATDRTEARRIIDLAHQHRRLLLCAPFTVLSPTFQAVARRLAQGDLGRVVSARARYGWAGPDWTDWFYKPGGGALFDLGVYQLTTLTGWLGPVRRVTAFSGIAIPERSIRGHPTRVEADDTTHLLLDFGNACLASLFAGFTIQQYQGPGLELYGTEGTLYLHGDDWDPDGYELWQNRAGCWQRYKETDPAWPWADGLNHLVDCLLHDTPPRVAPDHAYHVLDVMLSAQEAARDGRAREVTSIFTPPTTVTPSGALAEAAHRVHDRTRVE
ncbi:MAG: Gfo/Idh/MocA family oxidoreductase [Verrucomicrobiales bacterium]|nr:Gfo/Idh/MocA family oxidoreductase [Verrucomicrobiales bacterium]